MKTVFAFLPMLVCGSLLAQDLAYSQSNQSKSTSPNCGKQECPPSLCPCYQRGDDPLQSPPLGCQGSAAYNYPANVSVTNCWGVDFFADVSYLYWYANQEGLQIASTGYANSDDTFQPSTQDGFVVTQEFEYTSGFKLGLGANLNVDDWVVDLEYTYLRQNTSTSAGPAPVSTVGSGVYNLAAWFLENEYSEGIVATNVSSKWKLGLDWLDLMFSRPYYQGRRLTVSPAFGLRASWIRQKMHVSSPDAYHVELGTAPEANASDTYSNSWALGPRALVGARWLLGEGFRFQANAGASLLFTQYTTLSHAETGAVEPIGFSIHDYNCLRPMMEANLGVGWGTYFFRDAYHLDFAATYDFNYLWSQNMMRYALGANSSAPYAAAPADLFLHGLTVKARFDF